MSNSYHMPTHAAPDTPRVEIEVDGKTVRVPDKVNLVEALQTAGIETPHFCYHPDLPTAGNCRQCMVETDGPRGMGLAIACYTSVRAGMKVATDRTSDKVRSVRKAVMEFLLVNHPLDCPICDKAGECTLQENYMQAGRHESRLREEVGKVYKGDPDLRHLDAKGQVRGGKLVDLGPTVILDQERCILCDRCTRFMRDVAGHEQLQIVSRGDRAYLTTFPGRPLDHAYDLNVTDICPVGALTGKHFRFRQRVWMLARTESIAPDDSLGANITLEHNEGIVWRIMPRRNPLVNRSWIRNDTRLLHQELDRNRLLAGVIDGTTVSLRQARDQAQDRLFSARRVALVASGHLTMEDNTALLALAAALGDRAEVFGGSWLQRGVPDGIARSGDPVANREGLLRLGVPDNLDEFIRCAADFDLVVLPHLDLWAQDPLRAETLLRIGQRIALSPWNTATVACATVAVGIRAWAEVRGTMVNCHGRLQRQSAAPTSPSPDLEPAWQVLARWAGLRWGSEADALARAGDYGPTLRGVTWRAIGSAGLLLPPRAETEA